MAIVESPIGGGGLFSNVLGVNVRNVLATVQPPVIWLSKSDWTNATPLEVNVAADNKGTPLATPVLIEAAYDGAFKNIAAHVTTRGPVASLGYMKTSQVFIRARYAGTVA